MEKKIYETEAVLIEGEKPTKVRALLWTSTGLGGVNNLVKQDKINR